MRFLFLPATDTQITHGQRLWLYLLAFLVLLFLIVPVLLVIPISFTASTFLEFPPREYSLRWYREFFQSRDWQNATFVSLRVAVLTTLFATPMGTAAAYSMRVGRFRSAAFQSGILVSPMLIPVILIAIGVFFLYVPLRLNNTIAGLVIAHTALGIPLVFVLILARLQSYDMNQELVARSLGASPLRAFLKITVPQIKFSILSGALLAFINSLDEVIVAVFVASGPVSTLTKRMFLTLEFGIEPTIAAISTLLIMVTVTVVLITQFFAVRRSK